MKTIPIALQAHKDRPDTTLAYLVKITPVVGVTPAPVFGVTSNSADIVYDDGTGALTYHASNGADLSNLSSSLDLGVDNAEVTSLLSEFDIGTITEADVQAGKLDYAEFVTYRVNWANLGDGHEIVQSGTLGEATTVDGLSVTLETRSLSQQMKRPIVEGDSITCRAVFGSMSGDPGIRFPCNFDTTAEWINVTVTAVGAEPDLQFSVSGLAVADGFLSPGIVQWLTGANAGRTHEIETQMGSTITLVHPANFDVAVGDTARVRRDCAKRYVEDCINRFNNRQNFRGEPLIPQGEEGSTQVSGSASAAPANPQPAAVPAVQGTVPVMAPSGGAISNLDFELGASGWIADAPFVGTFTVINDAAAAQAGNYYGAYEGNPGSAGVDVLSYGIPVFEGNTLSVSGNVNVVSSAFASTTQVILELLITSQSPQSSLADISQTFGSAVVTDPDTGSTGGWVVLPAISGVAVPASGVQLYARVGVRIKNSIANNQVLIDSFALSGVVAP